MPGRRKLILLASTVIAGCWLSGLNAAERPAPRALGLITVSGSVLVDQLPAPHSSIVFAGDTVTTGKDSAAVVRFRSGVTLAVSENSEVEFSKEASTDLKIRQGALTINSPDQKAARVKVLGTSVVVQGRQGSSAICRIAALGNRAEVVADRGEMEILGRGAPIHLAQGRFARLEAGARHAVPGTPAPAGRAALPQSGARKAGTVTGAIPSETVQPQGKSEAVPLQRNDSVNWQDLVKTLNTGRVRITLLDGSVLNIGARSEMRITEHNPQTQQTEVELKLGKMRSQVVKLTKPGSSFQVKTQTAVIGVVGTIFVVEAEQATTKVTCIEGEVSVQNINPAVQGQVHLGPGQSTVVAEGAAPTAASAASVADIQAAVQRTEIPPGAGSEATAGQAGTGAGNGAAAGVQSGTTGTATSVSITTGVVVASGGAAGAVSGIAALNAANDANSGLNQAGTALQQAIDAANTATTVITETQQAGGGGSTPCGCGPLSKAITSAAPAPLSPSRP